MAISVQSSAISQFRNFDARTFSRISHGTETTEASFCGTVISGLLNSKLVMYLNSKGLEGKRRAGKKNAEP